MVINMALQRIGTVIMLTAGSIWDIRGKRIPAGLLALNILAGVILIAANRNIDWRQDWYLYVVGILIGIMLFLIGRFCGGIGSADGIMTAVIGGMIGYRETLLLLMNAILAAAVFSILLIVIKKAGRGTAIPFIPFMLLGYIIILIL